MPNTDAELQQAKQHFFQIAGMPCVIGEIDGSLVYKKWEELKIKLIFTAESNSTRLIRK